MPISALFRPLVDDVLRKNIDFQGRAGLRPKVVRTAERKCCRWCPNLAGVYEYPDVPDDVYRRHENCRCSVEYDPGDGKKLQNVHSKKWISKENSDNIKARKALGKYEKDIQLPKSIGAKHKPILVRLPDGSETTLTDGSRITKVETIAGLGRNRQIDIVDVLVNQYPGTQPEMWRKRKGLGYVDYYGESYHAELHWYEEPSVGKVKFKVKPDADGNWFYED